MSKHPHHRLSRRVFLRGAGGALVAAPFLFSVAERRARAQSLTAAATPKRLIVMFTHYGCITNQWFPGKAHGPLTADHRLCDCGAKLPAPEARSRPKPAPRHA